MSDIIRELRDRTGLSQSEFAKYFSIPVSTLRKWEQGDCAPAEYMVRLLAMQIPAKTENLEKIVASDGSVFYLDMQSNYLMDTLGNKIFFHESLDGVKERNLPVYVKDLFESYYEITKKFDRDLMYDKKEDFIWG